MPVTILYSEAPYPDDSVEREVMGEGPVILQRDLPALADVSDADCAAADGLLVFRHWITDADLARMPRLRAIVRMGVGYDRVDRQAAARRGVMVCNLPDYGTTEVADHAMALALTLRRGLLLHHDAQRATPPAPWTIIRDPLLARLSAQTFGILGLGRIGTAVALRAKAFGFRVVFFDPFLPNGVELALGIKRVRSLEDLLRQSDVLSIHAPLTRQTKGMVNREALSLLPKGAVLVNTARGPIVDVDAVAALLRDGHLAGAGLDVLPVEPPVEPLPELFRAYRAREAWVEGRLIVTPHSAFYTPHAWADIRRKAAETIRAALLTNAPQNVIAPEDE
jgi:C-terminal binding protein